MILGIGTDLTSIERIRHVLDQHGGRFVERCFAVEEQERVERAGALDAQVRAAGYAKRWAAKEACAKALGRGIRDEIYLKDIVVVNDADGKPSIMLRGGAANRLAQLVPAGMQARLDVSLTDEMPMAMAFVVISAQAAV